MATEFKIHPAISIARLGNSPQDFYIVPESPAGLPIECDIQTGVPTREDGKEVTASTFKDGKGRIKRQAARFRVYAHQPDGTSCEVRIGETLRFVHEHTGQVMEGKLENIEWTVYVANKKAIWYQFLELAGEHGYAPGHPLRNADVIDEDRRQQLIIDPGPQTVCTPAAGATEAERKSFACGENGNTPQSFPPALNPNSISTLGEILGTRDGDHARLLVLAGYGNSGSAQKGLGDPKTTNYANNEGWFDDIADGPVEATLLIKVSKVDGKEAIPAVLEGNPVAVPASTAWVITAYPAYLPQIENIIRLDEAIYDMSLRELAYDPHLYGVPPFDDPKPPETPEELAVWREHAYFNPDYYPYFWRDIWPILRRPHYLIYLMVFDPFLGAGPHQQIPNQNFDPGILSEPPHQGQDPKQREQYRQRRFNIYNALRKPGQDNVYMLTPDPKHPEYHLRGMPELCGDNPISNTLPVKFLTLTRTMLFLLERWAEGKFINECSECLIECKDGRPPDSYWYHEPRTAAELDRGVISNGLGGAFCPGGEVSWIIRNPAIYQEPFRIRASTSFTPGALTLLPQATPGSATVAGGISGGLEPGDITKYNAVPWQTDFNECSTQPVDLTYQEFNQTYPASTGDTFQQDMRTIWWWPTHRPLWVMNKQGEQSEWTQGIPQSHTGDMMMVRAWSALGFIVKYEGDDATVPQFYQQERNTELITGGSHCPKGSTGG